jgi:hypothetical protein
MSPRVIQLPMSGRDRRHYVRELARVEQLHAQLVRQVADAFAAADAQLRVAHFRCCEEWNARQFLGGPIEPSPTIADAIHGGVEMLEVRCRRCGHSDLVDLALLIWPRDNPIHTLERALGCRPCKATGQPKTRPELVALRTRHPIEPEPPAAGGAAQKNWIESAMMKFVEPRPLSDPDAAARKLLELANAIEADHMGRVAVATLNAQFIAAGAGAAEYRGAVAAAVARGWLTPHPSGAYLTFTQAGADLFA